MRIVFGRVRAKRARSRRPSSCRSAAAALPSSCRHTLDPPLGCHCELAIDRELTGVTLHLRLPELPLSVRHNTRPRDPQQFQSQLVVAQPGRCGDVQRLSVGMSHVERYLALRAVPLARDVGRQHTVDANVLTEPPRDGLQEGQSHAVDLRGQRPRALCPFSLPLNTGRAIARLRTNLQLAGVERDNALRSGRRGQLNLRVHRFEPRNARLGDVNNVHRSAAKLDRTVDRARRRWLGEPGGQRVLQVTAVVPPDDRQRRFVQDNHAQLLRIEQQRQQGGFRAQLLDLRQRLPSAVLNADSLNHDRREPSERRTARRHLTVEVRRQIGQDPRPCQTTAEYRRHRPAKQQQRRQQTHAHNHPARGTTTSQPE